MTPSLVCVTVFTQEAIEKKEKRARRFHFRAEDNVAQRNVVLDRELMKKGERSIIPVVQVCEFFCLV